MSRRGPQLSRTRDGRAVAKLSGRVLYFGRHDSPEAHERFGRVKAAWLAAGRSLTDQVLAALSETAKSADPAPTTTARGPTIDELANRYVEHLKEDRGEQWVRNNLKRRTTHQVQNDQDHDVDDHGCP